MLDLSMLNEKNSAGSSEPGRVKVAGNASRQVGCRLAEVAYGDYRAHTGRGS